MRTLVSSAPFVAAALVAAVAVIHPAAQQTGPRAARGGGFGAGAQVVLTPGSVRGTLNPPPEPWRPRPNDERPRGGVETYAAAAPAVVVVRTSDGHGTGFLISADGLILTNHHVVSSGLTHEANASYAMVHLGQLGTAGIMDLRGDPIRAAVLKVDPLRDLALLRLPPGANGGRPLPFIRLSPTAPRPGMDCSILGHPSSGMLWTFRPCQVASIGTWPADLVNLVMPRLAAAGTTRQAADSFVARQPGHRIMLTSAQANPGDSGGPVLDASGMLIGVTFATPGDADERRFTYHVHLDEVRSFLANVPVNPMLLVPDPWDLPPRIEVRDLDGDGVADVLVAGHEAAEVFMFDLDGDSPRPTRPEDVPALVEQKRWNFEAVVDLRGSGYTAYYETLGTGGPDLILMTALDAPAAEGQFVRGAGNRWTYAPVRGRPILDPTAFRSQVLARRFATALDRLNWR